MENTAEALKMAFAMFVFILALTITIATVGQARTAADAVFYATDKTNYYEYQQSGQRTVGIETILPTVYRYSKENYGVTIIDGSTIVARFDVDTEEIINSYANSEDPEDKEKVKEHKEELYNKLGLGLSPFNMNKRNFVEYRSIENLYQYKYTSAGVTKTQYGAPWNGITAEIVKRLDTDFSGKESTFQGNKTYKGCISGRINEYI